MKYFKQVSKRSFAMLLTLIMAMGLLQTTAFAEASGDSLFSRDYHIYDQNIVDELNRKTLNLNINVGVGETWVDEGVFRFWDMSYGVYNVSSWDDFDIWSTNEDVLKVTAVPNGKSLKIIYEGIADGTAQIKMAFNLTTISTGEGSVWGSGNWGAAACANCTVGTATVGTGSGGGGGDTSKPEKPTDEEIQDFYSDANRAVIVRCVDSSYHNGSLSRLAVGSYTIGEVEAYDGSNRDLSTSEWGWMCKVHVDQEYYLNLWHRNFQSTRGTHYLVDKNQDVYAPFYYFNGGYCSYAGANLPEGWYCLTEDAPVYVDITHQAPIIPTYTVTYTDGVLGKTVFPDQGYEGLKEGDATPEFEGGDPTSYTDDGGNTYTFQGWSPAVNPVVSADDADDDGNIVYTATWQKNTPELKELTVSKTPSEEYPVVGEEFTYTIKVTNPNSKAIKVKITDVLDLKLDLVWDDEYEMYGISDGGSYDPATRTVTWTDVEVPANGDKTVTLTVKANAAGEIYNEAKIKSEVNETSGNTTVTAKEPDSTKRTFKLIYHNESGANWMPVDESAEKGFLNMPEYQVDTDVTENPHEMKVSDKTPTRDGYTFKHWQWGGDANAKFNPGDTITLTADPETVTEVAADLYAVWEKNDTDPKWTVNWMKGYETEGENFGETVPDTVPVKTETIKSETIPTVPQEDYPTDSTMQDLRDDSKFIGWGEPVVDETNRVITITAKWETTENINVNVYKSFDGVEASALKDDFQMDITVTDLVTGETLTTGTITKSTLTTNIKFNYVVEHGYKITAVESNYEIAGYNFVGSATKESVTEAASTPVYSEGMISGSAGTCTFTNKYTKDLPAYTVTKDAELTVVWEENEDGTEKKDGKVIDCYVDYTVTLTNNSLEHQYFVQLRDVMENGLTFVTKDGKLDGLTFKLEKSDGSVKGLSDVASESSVNLAGVTLDKMPKLKDCEKCVGQSLKDNGTTANNTVATILFQLANENGGIFFEPGDKIIVTYRATVNSNLFSNATEAGLEAGVKKLHNHVYSTTWDAPAAWLAPVSE